MKQLLGILFLFLIIKTCSTQNKSLHIKYRTAFAIIEVSGDSLKITKKNYSYGNTPSANPTSVSETHSQRKLTKEEINQIIDLISRKELYELKNEYGVSKEQRFYPYELEVKYKDKYKKIIYRSSPLTTEKPPELFNKITDLLTQLSGKN